MTTQQITNQEMQRRFSRSKSDTLSDAINSLTIPEIAMSLGYNGLKSGNNKSPFRPEMRDSFSVYDAGQKFKDHGTEDQGGVWDFVQLAKPSWSKKEVAEHIIRAAGMELAKHEKKRRIVATYDYTDGDGELLFQVVRYHPKDFRQRRPDGKGGWIWNTKNVDKPLYRSAAIREAITNEKTVWLVEGEKDVHSAESVGLDATTNPGGQGKWYGQYSEMLRGATVNILYDQEPSGVGLEHAHKVARSLHGIASQIKIVTLDHGGKDVTDYCEERDTLSASQVREEIEAAAEKADVYKPEPKAKSRSMNNNLDSLKECLWDLSQEKHSSATEFYRKASKIVVEWLHHHGRLYHHSAHRDFQSVMYFNGGNKLLENVNSDAFQARLAEEMGINRTERMFAFTISAIETEGLSNRSTAIEPEQYFARRNKTIYISNGQGSMTKVTATEVQLVDNGADGVLFPSEATLPQWEITKPENPFEKCRLFRDSATTAEHGKLLCQLWAMSLPLDPTCKPPICFTSPPGGGKTAQVRGIFNLFGIPEQISKLKDNGEGDFWTAVNAGGIHCIDNADTKNDWIADALAAAATAGSLQKRKLYTDHERVTLKARAWIAVTSANPSFASDAGLADRLLVVRMERRKGETAEGSLYDEVTAMRDAGLSFIAENLSKALSDTNPTPKGLNSRHPDWAAFAVRIGRAIGKEGESVQALKSAEADKHMFNLENDWIASAILDVCTKRQFDGTAAELLEQMIELDEYLNGRVSAQRLSKRIAKLWPHLEAVVGAKVEKCHGGYTRYIFSKLGEA